MKKTVISSRYLEQSSSVIRANVPGWNAYDNELVRLSDRASDWRDDVSPIETSRPDTRKAKGYLDNHVVSLAMYLKKANKVCRRRKSRFANEYVREHLHEGHLPPAEHLKLRYDDDDNDDNNDNNDDDGFRCT
ncbi:hypothetical protein HZH66_007021 [Vespula vulgaris]|uniref:Uncharacterized protein n=1 Tax=Vespula vulgaris TaxID=7454 RepID=A0A834JWS7_VESVU|nr:hypothetical protein HZH66_007021 [Vespula vulgaris]